MFPAQKTDIKYIATMYDTQMIYMWYQIYILENIKNTKIHTNA